MTQLCRRDFAATIFAAVTAVLMAAAGCQQPQRSTKVPQAAAPLGQAKAQPFTWQADRTGTLYVVDAPDDMLLYHGPIRTGQMLVVDPQVKRISVDGRTVSEGKFKSGHRNDVYLQSGAVRTEKPERADRIGEAQ